jgi:SAM-dependent methyltransferase
MNGNSPGTLQESYSQLADEYATRIYNELAHKPLDQELLKRFAEQTRGSGPVCDMGCGPGQVARYLHDLGVEVVGMDIAPGMIEKARTLNPDIEFRQGNMRALDVEDNAWGGIAAFYSVIHIPRDQVVDALREMKRVLRPGGVLLLTFHIGDETVHREELWGVPVSIDFLFFQPEEMRGYIEEAGFEVEEMIEREPYPDVEYPSRRAYIFARKPEADPT